MSENRSGLSDRALAAAIRDSARGYDNLDLFGFWLSVCAGIGVWFGCYWWFGLLGFALGWIPALIVFRLLLGWWLLIPLVALIGACVGMAVLLLAKAYEGLQKAGVL
jgi:hypothetical protein